MSDSDERKLQALRTGMEAVDADLVRLIGRRQALAAEIGSVKRRAGLAVLDPEREAAVVRRAVELGREAGVSEGLMRNLFWRIVAGAREIQLEGSQSGRPGC